jgi:hypothetical protein
MNGNHTIISTKQTIDCTHSLEEQVIRRKKMFNVAYLNQSIKEFISIPSATPSKNY